MTRNLGNAAAALPQLCARAATQLHSSRVFTALPRIATSV